MDVKKFLAGLGFLLAGYLMYRLARRSEVASEKNNWDGLLRQNYFGIWFSAIGSIIIGIVFILESF